MITTCIECRRLHGHKVQCDTGRSGGCVRCERNGTHYDDVADHWYCGAHAGPLAWSDAAIRVHQFVDRVNTWLAAETSVA